MQRMLQRTAEPPIAQAMHDLNEQTNVLNYDYNGRTIISISLPAGVKPYFRRASDGNLQSSPFVQQLYLAFDHPSTARVKFQLSSDTLNMRPRRATSGEAILGQVGRPTLFGVNGLYDALQDLLIDWHGAEWKWACSTIEQADNGNSVAVIDVKVGTTPWIINLRMQYYRKHLNFSHHKPWERRPDLKPIVGWCSWEAYRCDVTEEYMISAAQFVSDHFKAYGLEYVQLDDGFQLPLVPPTADSLVADAWLTTNKKFPSGHAGLVKRINETGLKAGIWTNAVVTNAEFACLKNACIKDQEGIPLKGRWIHYVLDCTPETLAKHVAPYYKGLKEAGYSYFKTDAIRHLIYDGLHEAVKAGLISNDGAQQKFRAFLACAREQLGDEAYLLACWGVLEEAVGIADACRIATDSDDSWPAIRMQLVETARWFHTQRILFLNDSDHVCVRAPLEWAKSAISLISLSGSLLMISDKPENYDDERISMIQRNLPVLSTVTAETGPLDITYSAFAWTHVQRYAVDLGKAEQTGEQHGYDHGAELAGGGQGEHPLTSLWAFHMQQADRTWCVAGRFATEPLQASELEFRQLSLDPQREYAVFDFWEQCYVGKYTSSIRCRELEEGHCQILAIRSVGDHPALLASSRHVSMDAVSVLEERWEQETSSLKLRLAGVSQTAENYWIYVPDGYKASNLELTGGDGTFTQFGESLQLNILFQGEAIEAILRFEREAVGDAYAK